MKLLKHLPYVAGFVIAAAVWSAAAERALGQFTLTGNPVELVARGINADFELPDTDPLDRNDAETASGFNQGDNPNPVAGGDIGAGWTFNLISGASSNHGVQDPNETFFGGHAPLPATFEGRQIGFFNLDAFSQAEIISDPVGLLRAGQQYTLNVAVGARNAGFRDIDYRVGLRASDGTDLGDFATATLVPGSSATNIVDLQYTLDMTSVPGFVGDAVSIVVGGFNTGILDGVVNPGFTQANFDNVRLAGVFDELPPPQSASLTINRQTGGIELANTGAADLNVLGYSLKSSAGSFNQAAWNRIGGDFTTLTDPDVATDLSEFDFEENGIVFTTGSSLNFGNAWLRTPFEDVQGQLLLDDGTPLDLEVQYTGASIVLGDLNADGLINAADWNLFKAGQGSNFTGLSQAQGYSKGDLNGDGSHDLTDFVLFRQAFELANGAGSFAAMLAVPEPSAGLLLVVGGLLTLTGVRRRNRWQAVFATNRIARHAAALLVSVMACALAAAPANAQDVVAHWSFDSPTLTIDGGNIVQVAEATGNHNATPGTGGTGGAGNEFVSAPFDAASSSVSGQFGEALRFNGDNFLLFNNLTELMQSSGAPNYTVSMWVNAPGVSFTSAHPFATLSNWGNEPAAAGATRFTYAFGPAGASSMRGQTRFASGTSGVDIYASTITTPAPINDGNWRMLTWTFDTTTGLHQRYFDGQFVSSLTSGAASFQMADSSSAVGGMGIKGDNGVFLPAGVMLDEVWVFDDVLTDEQIESLFNINNIVPISLTLRVDPATGQVQLRNDSGDDIALNAYRISSAAGSLNPSGWNPISNQSIPGFPAGDGSGNGWEAPSAGASPAGDFNGDGVVDAADYVWLRKNGGSPANFNTWRADFGASGGVGNPNPGELVEWYLQGESTLADGAAISLGQAFNIGGTEDLVLEFTTGSNVRTGAVEYAAIGSGAALGQAVPEPATGWLLLMAGGALAACRRRRPAARSAALARVTACLIVTLVTATSAVAAVTQDRLYLFGENTSGNNENGAPGITVGSANTTSPGTTLDHNGPPHIDLTVVGQPVYADVSDRPGAASGALGILFEGDGKFLSGFSLGFPHFSRKSIHRADPGSNLRDYTGLRQRGFQLWVNPHAGATATQHIVSDTTQHGVRITAAGNWALVHAGAEINSNVAANFNQWAHVMAAMPDMSVPSKAVLYVNGEAIALHQANYSTSQTVTFQEALIVGANSNADGGLVGTTNFFRGVLDELEMFVWGRGFNTDFGTFSFLTDNGYAAMNLSPLLGDLTNTGSISQDDVDAFVAGFGHEKTIGGVRVGDVTTYLMGDLNFDGVTDLRDAWLMRQALMSSGAGAGLDLAAFTAVTGLAVPEPSSLWLATAVAMGGLVVRARRKK